MATAVICEFNPFHNGHAYLLSEARRLTNEPNLAIMSGSFTQRGEVAICDKFTRAGAALRHGADLVAELPTAYAVANAERFARGGVRIAKSFSEPLRIINALLWQSQNLLHHCHTKSSFLSLNRKTVQPAPFAKSYFVLIGNYVAIFAHNQALSS